MHRRSFLTLLGTSAAAWPLAAGAQQPALPIIGYLSIGPASASNVNALRKGLGEHGYVDGRNFTFQFRDTEQYDRLTELAAELVRQRVAVIVTQSSVNTAEAAKGATTTIPIVFALGNDPVKSGLVAKFRRPGGNVTGVTYLGSEMAPKLLELLRELAPQRIKIALLANPANLQIDANMADLEAAARSVRQEIIVLRASTASEIETAFRSLVEQRAGGLVVVPDGFFASRREQLVTLASFLRIPTVYYAPEFAAAGGLMSYSDDRNESWRQVGLYVGRILKGEKPADLPVLQPVKFDFIINLKSAKALGIDFPPSFQLRATEVIE